MLHYSMLVGSRGGYDGLFLFQEFDETHGLQDLAGCLLQDTRTSMMLTAFLVIR